MPSSFCQPSTGNSDSEPEEKCSGFRLKPPTLIHGQAPSAGLPSQKPKELQRSVLRPAVLQAPQPKSFSSSVLSSGTNGINMSPEPSASPPDDPARSPSAHQMTSDPEKTSLPKTTEPSSDSNKENATVESGSETSSLEATPEKSNNISESLAESAAAYTKATAKRCLLEKVEVITGEEAESNVLQIQCKLFVFDKVSQSWVERGRGLLRLNDMASTDDGMLQSRLVMRTQGSLRLILNTKLWAQMQIDKASEKSIRITAMDTEDQGVKVFLISASSKDTGQLYAALHHRIQALRSRVEQELEVKFPEPEREVTQSNEDDSDDDVLSSGAAAGATSDDGDRPPASST
ncbi:hypothetical protein FKM82_014845 [Ascaphus truei]